MKDERAMRLATLLHALQSEKMRFNELRTEHKEKHALCGTIHDQRLRLAQLEKENRDFKLTNKTADGG